jgi:hypothetical protein
MMWIIACVGVVNWLNRTTRHALTQHSMARCLSEKLTGNALLLHKSQGPLT